MKILITGASGLIGHALSNSLASDDVQVLHLRRDRTGLSHHVVIRDGALVDADGDFLSGVDAVVNLGGEPILGDRWNSEKRDKIVSSRVNGTDDLVRALFRLVDKPKVIISASGINFYGYHHREVRDEHEEPGSGFLCDVTSDWEEAVLQIASKSTRVVRLRLGIVLSKDGGALSHLLKIFKWGLGGPVGDGARYMSWISLTDVVRLIRHCLSHEEITGVVHGVAPQPVTNREFTISLAKCLGVPAIIPVPPFALRLLYGVDLANETILSDLRVYPTVAVLNSGFQYEHGTIDQALQAEVQGLRST
jgi:uncharacterized protein (TIGR01777 family)